MSVRDDARKDYEAGLKYKEIADKHNVSESTVKSWASRYWKKDKVATKNRKKSQPKSKKDATHKRGGQFNNLNAAGSTTNGAPKGNTNALKHGGYSAIYWDTLSDDEKELIEQMPENEEELLIDQLKLYSINERRLLLAIQKVKSSLMVTDENGELKPTEKVFNDSITTISNYYNSNGKNTSKNVIQTANHEHIDNRFLRLQAELTKVQRAKNKTLDSLFRLHCEAQKLEILRNNGKEDTKQLIDDWIAAVMEAEK